MKTESYISIEGDITLPIGKSSGGPQTLPLPLPSVWVFPIVKYLGWNKLETVKFVPRFLGLTPSSDIGGKVIIVSHWRSH